VTEAWLFFTLWLAIYLTGSVFFTCVFHNYLKTRHRSMSRRGYVLWFFAWPVIGAVAFLTRKDDDDDG
jgi:hypothetical protein